ncbi:MAG: type I-E CRISPR-associated protein Cas7/Cse4/CasC [Chromatiaceae bacterium]|nr:type I-E CRISPR-associated protein Cas7/Cse4/CasC [Chromatiaceae bacterium]
MKVIQLHSLFSLPVHIPNRGADGLAKRAVFGGVERQRISYQAQQYALRKSPEMAGLEAAGGIGHSYRTALVGDRLLKLALEEAGITPAEAWSDAIMALWRKEKEKTEVGEHGHDAEETTAPLIVGEQEVRLFVAVARTCADADIGPTGLRPLIDKRAPKGTPEAVIQAIEALRSTRGSVGFDGALFGRMATGIAVATVDRAVRISDALTTHAITPVVDFFLVTDDLKNRAAGEAGGSHINTREEAAGLFYRHVLIDTAQLRRNGIDPAAVLAPLVVALHTVSPIGNRSPARIIESLVEIGGQVRSLMDAFAAPVAQQERAVARLRAMATEDYATFGKPPAAFWLSEQPAPRIASLAQTTQATWEA